MAYRELYPNANWFSYTRLQEGFQIFQLGDQIAKSEPSELIFIDHMPHPRLLIKAFQFKRGRKRLPPTTFHVYGDFTLYSKDWLELQPILKGSPVRIFAASPRQRDLIGEFLKKKSAIDICPFPVNTQFFSSSPQLREEVRNKMNLKDQDFLALYTGRLSIQKNVLRLLREMIATMKEDPSVHFAYAGSFDAIDAHFFGIRNRANALHDRWFSLIQEQPPEIQNRIHNLGQLENKELVAYYNAADLYTSISTHHDEDFGMSPIEALFCGTPCLLSDWGGYSGFNFNPKAVQFVPIAANNSGLRLSSKNFQNTFFKMKRLFWKPEEKQLLIEQAQNRFSISAVVDLLRKKSAKRPLPFSGFSKTFQEYNERYEKFRHGAALYPEGPGKNGLYFKIYKHYLGQPRA